VAKHTYTHTHTAMKEPRSHKIRLGRRPTIVLTGRRENRHHIVEVCGREGLFTFGDFTALSQLICALVSTAAGTCPLGPMTVLRLRRALDRAAAQKGTGKSLIHAASDGEYFLALDQTELGIDNTFPELGPKFIDPATQKTILRALSRNTSLSQEPTNR